MLTVLDNLLNLEPQIKQPTRSMDRHKKYLTKLYVHDLFIIVFFLSSPIIQTAIGIMI